MSDETKKMPDTFEEWWRLTYGSPPAVPDRNNLDDPIEMVKLETWLDYGMMMAFWNIGARPMYGAGVDD